MAQIPLSNDAIREMVNKAAERADVTIESCKHENAMLRIVIRSEHGTIALVESTFYWFEDDRDLIQQRMNRGMTMLWSDE